MANEGSRMAPGGRRRGSEGLALGGDEGGIALADAPVGRGDDRTSGPAMVPPGVEQAEMKTKPAAIFTNERTPFTSRSRPSTGFPATSVARAPLLPMIYP